MVVARARDLVWPTTPEWRARVREEIAAGKRGTQAKLAAHCKCASSAISEMLSEKSDGDPDGRRYSKFVGPVHEFFGWPPPPQPDASGQIAEIQQIIDDLGDDGLDFLKALRAMSPALRKAHMALAIAEAQAKSEH